MGVAGEGTDLGCGWGRDGPWVWLEVGMDLVAGGWGGGG